MHLVARNIPVHFQWLPLAPGYSVQPKCNQMDDPSDDPALKKYAALGALAEAREQWQQKSREVRAQLLYEQIDHFVEVYFADPTPTKEARTRDRAVYWATKAYGVSRRTVEAALAFMKKKRERLPLQRDAPSCSKHS